MVGYALMGFGIFLGVSFFAGMSIGPSSANDIVMRPIDWVVFGVLELGAASLVRPGWRRTRRSRDG